MVWERTIEKNIRYGKLEATDEEIYKAALRANAIGFIEGGKADQKQEQELKIGIKILEYYLFLMLVLAQQHLVSSKERM